MSKYTKEVLENAVNTNESMAGVLRFFGLHPSGGSYVHLKKRIQSFNIDTSHFLGQAINRGKPSGKRITKEDFVLKYLVISDKNIAIKTHVIKQRLIRFGFKEEICKKCKRIEWNGLKIPLEMHHLNGIRWDNRINNLQLLCPNCHAQTDNHCGKNKKKMPR